MKVIEHLRQATEPLISFEIIPPLRGGNLRELLGLIEDLADHRPPFIDITSHAAQVVYEEEAGGGLRRKVKRKRPGTLGVCALIQNKYDIDAVPHVLCEGFTREETEDFLIELRYLGIDNVLAVRGDESTYKKPLQGRSVNPYAEDLVRQIADMNAGRYLQEDLLDAEPSDFCIGVGGYPEKHCESPNLETDIERTKAKVDAGGEYIVTQMFFDNRHYFDYVDRCREAGIEVPIVPGLKILGTLKQLQTLPRSFYCEIPYELSRRVATATNDREAEEIGIDWAVRQSEELLARGVQSLHYYVMQSSRSVNQVMERLQVKA
jgi:methylenetetrahydrofolate reductase (NADPH)